MATEQRSGRMPGAAPASPTLALGSIPRDNDAYLDLFENATFAMHSVGADGTILRANRAELDLLGYAPDEYIGHNVASFHADQGTVDDLLQRLGRGETVRDYEVRVRHKDGSWRYMLLSGSARIEAGNFVHTRCLMRDITREKQAEDDARLRNDQLQRALDAARIGVLTLDEHMCVESVNAAAVRLFGISASDVAGQNLDKLISLDSGAHVTSLRDGAHQVTAERADGSVLDIELTITQTRHTGRRSYTAIARDVSAQAATSRALYETRDRYRRAQTAARLGTWDWDFRTGKLDWDGVEEVHGLAPGTFGGTLDDFLELMHPDDSAAAVAAIEEAVRVHGEMTVEYRTHRPDGSLRWIAGRGRIFTDDNGEPLKMAGTCQDVTERRALEEEALLRSTQIRRVTDAMPALIAYVDRDCRYRFSNQTYQEWYGRDPAEVVGRQVPEILGQRAYEVIRPHVEKALAGESVTFEAFMPYDTGAPRYVRATYTPDIGPRNQVRGFFALVEDVSAYKQIEETLTDIGNRYHTLAELMPEMIMVRDASGEVQYCNQQLLEYTGLSLDQVKAGGFFDAMHPDDLAAHVGEWRQMLLEHRPIEGEYRVRRHDGMYRWHLGRAAPVMDERGEFQLWIMAQMDIDDRKRAEELSQAALNREKEARTLLDTILDKAPLGISVFDRKLRYIRINAAGAELNRLPVESHIGRRIDQVLRCAGPQVLDRLRHVIETGESIVDVEESSEHPNDPARLRWWVKNYYAVRDAQNNIAGVAVIFRDITQRREIEEQQAQLLEDLRRANSAKDEFLGLVSHELKTPITTIYGNAEVLRSRGDMLDGDSRRAAIEDVSSESERLHRVIDNLLVLARLERGQAIEVEPVLVRRVVDRLTSEHRQRCPRRPLSVEGDLSDTLVMAEPTYLDQVLRNLLSNAEKYSKPAEPITVRITRASQEVIVAVLDGGAGFSEEEAQRLFEPFYRSPSTAAFAGGVGVGLAVCRRLIEAQGGRIWARPRPDRGAEVAFSLPVPSELD